MTAEAGGAVPGSPEAVRLALDELWCDLPGLMGRASAEGHAVGQMLARQVQAKIRRACGVPAWVYADQLVSEQALRLVVQQFREGRLSEGEGAVGLGMDRAAFRALADRVQPIR